MLCSSDYGWFWSSHLNTPPYSVLDFDLEMNFSEVFPAVTKQNKFGTMNL